MVDGHGKEYPVRKHKDKERYYIQTATGQLTVTSMVRQQPSDCVYEYIFNGGFKNYPCPAMDYWIYRHRLKNVISAKEYAIKLNIKRKFGKPLLLHERIYKRRYSY
jgi:hypothetical protein